MDPRIGWHQNELSSSAYSTWTNIWMIAQMNCTSSSSSSTLTTHGSSSSILNNTNNNTQQQQQQRLDENNIDKSNSYSKFISMIEMSSNNSKNKDRTF